MATAVVAALAGAGCSSAVRGPAGAARGDGWVATWAASPVAPAPDVPSHSGRTVRMVVRTSLGGDRVRVRLSNEFGKAPLEIGAAHAGLRRRDAALAAGSNRALTFRGAPSVTIPAGGFAISDPVDLAVPAMSDLAVSLFVARSAGPATLHAESLQTSYLAAGGNVAASDDGAAFGVPVTGWAFVTGVDVHAAAGARSVVAFGDSITDGLGSTQDSNGRWPDQLARRLQAAGRTIAVVNAGISGNRLLRDAPGEIPHFGPSGLSRFERDALGQTGATHVVVLLGINDIGLPGALQTPAEAVTAEQIIAGYRQLIARARARGVKVIGGTLTPFDTYTDEGAEGYFTPAGEAVRQAINAWVRTTPELDGRIDFDAAVRDPAQPSKLRAAFDAGDHLHLSDAGYEAMAGAVELSLFDD